MSYAYLVVAVDHTMSVSSLNIRAIFKERKTWDTLNQVQYMILSIEVQIGIQMITIWKKITTLEIVIN